MIAVVALGLSAWALANPRSATTESALPSAQSEDARRQVCDAFNLVRVAVTRQTNVSLGTDPVAAQAVAANARLAALGGGQFLMSKLDAGLPSDLATAVRTFANDLAHIGMSQLAGERVEDPPQVERMNNAQVAAARITELCK